MALAPLGATSQYDAREPNAIVVISDDVAIRLLDGAMADKPQLWCRCHGGASHGVRWHPLRPLEMMLQILRGEVLILDFRWRDGAMAAHVMVPRARCRIVRPRTHKSGLVSD